MGPEIKATDKLRMELRFRGDLGDSGRPLPPEVQPNWWKVCNCYQVWPASFKDSNGDGLGDLKGLLSKLDYLKELGIDVVWLSPMYASPQVDMGYDISDYNAVYPPYGTMDDMDELIAGLHNRGMRLLLDLVINHTSDQHNWFLESKKSRDNKYADYYMWKDPKVGEDGERMPPNNWGAWFGGSAWEYVAERDQYYLHLFAKEQPDINWEDHDTREAVYDSALRFWFKKGVDGFRVDTSNIYSKDPAFPDGPVPDGKQYGDCHKFVANGPHIHEIWQQIRTKVLDKFGDPMMVGELGGSTFEEVLKYVSSEARELSMIFDFDFALVGGFGKHQPHELTDWKLPELKTGFKKIQDLVANTTAWGSVFMENHDMPRSVSRYATTDPEYHEKACKVLAMLLATLSGTLFVYQGQEIGMTNIPSTWSIDDLRDIAALNYLHEIMRDYPEDKEMLQKAWLGICQVGRDNARTPVQWSAEAHGGFTTGEPWMRVNDNYTKINVADQTGKKDSVLTFWKQVLKLRKEHKDVFIQGGYHIHDFDNEKTFTIQKTSAKGAVSVTILNFSADECEISFPKGVSDQNMKLVACNVHTPGPKLQAWEGRIYIQ